MYLSELITELNKIKEEYGDDVFVRMIKPQSGKSGLKPVIRLLDYDELGYILFLFEEKEDNDDS